MRHNSATYAIVLALALTVSFDIAFANEDIDKAKHFVHTSTDVLCGVLIGFGLLQCFFGYKLLKATLFISGFLAGGAASFYGMHAITKAHHSSMYLSLGALIIGGVFLGVLMLMLYYFGIFCIGAILGVSLASALQGVVLYHISPAHPHLVLYISTAVLGLVFGALALKFERGIVIFSTAFAGAYGAGFGIGHFAGKFPDPLDMEHAIKDGSAQSIPKESWFYMGGILIFAIAGVLVQFSTTRSREEEEEEDNVSYVALSDTGSKRDRHLYYSSRRYKQNNWAV